jgi:iron complex transport system substrate-binding protein
MGRRISVRIILRLMLPGLLIVVSQPMISVSAEYPALGIYGNANKDDAIDMRDVTCIERIILGLTPQSQLSDARHDGKVDMLDVTQTELIIVRKEQALTLLDERGDAITVRKPVKRVIPEHITSLAAMRVLNAKDKIVSIGSTAAKKCTGLTFLQDLAGLPTIGNYSQPDYEAILSLNPDLLIAYRCGTLQEKLPGVTVFYAGYGAPYPPEHLTVDIRKLGYILDKSNRAKAYIKWYKGHLDVITERVAGLLEDEKPRVYVFYPLTGLYMCKGTYPPVDIAGGINIGAGLGPGFATAVDPEWVIKQNPDVIIGTAIPDNGAYETDDTSTLIAEREKVLGRPELANVTAVKDKKVYFVNAYALGLFPNYLLSIAYYAKWLHPDLFKDLDPQAMHQEYLDKFQGINFDVSAHGVFIYPPPE